MSELNINNVESEKVGSFPSGLVVGFLAGAVGYFLTQTKEGKEIKEKISDHWNEIKENLIKDGKLSTEENEITDYIRVIREKIESFLGDINLDDQLDKKTSKKKIMKQRKKKLFKGI